VPDITDEFAAKVKPGMTAQSLMDELIKAIDEEDKKEFVPARNKALGYSLAQVMDVEVPDTLVTNQAREKFAMMMADMRDGGLADEEIKRQISPENFLKYKDIVKDDIVRDFKISMATDEIARLEGIDVPDYQVEEQMESIRKDAGASEDFDENMVRSKVETTLQRQAVMDWLADKSQLDVEYLDEDGNFDEELMKKLAEETLQREGVQEAAAVLEAAEAAVAAEETVAVVEAPAPSSAPVAPSKPAVEESEMTLQEKAYQALLKSGAIKVNKSPGDPDYDPSHDDEVAEGTIFKK
jgi:Bacterial trigger factor protein (TF) C-terminus